MEDIIHMLWLPTVINRFQDKFKQWYYYPTNKGANRALSHYKTLCLQ